MTPDHQSKNPEDEDYTEAQIPPTNVAAAISYDERLGDMLKQASSLIAAAKGGSEFLEHWCAHGSIGQYHAAFHVARLSVLAGSTGLVQPLRHVGQSLREGERPSWSDVRYVVANSAEIVEGGFRFAALGYPRFRTPAAGFGMGADVLKAASYYKKGDLQMSAMYACFAAANASTMIAEFSGGPVSSRTFSKIVKFAPRTFAATGVVVGLAPWPRRPDHQTRLAASASPPSALMSTPSDGGGARPPAELRRARMRKWGPGSPPPSTD
jgi:hypothetical protein